MYMNISRYLYLGLVITSVAGCSYGLGRLSVMEDSISHVEITETELSPRKIEEVSDPIPELQLGGEMIGVKSSKKYYFPWCGTVKRLKGENKVIFPSLAIAKEAGYVPAKNCKGLQ